MYLSSRNINKISSNSQFKTNKYISKGKRNLTEQGLKNSSATLLPKGSVLFSSRAPIGYVVIAKNCIATNQGFKNIIPKTKLVLSDFVYYFLQDCITVLFRFFKEKDNGKILNIINKIQECKKFGLSIKI